MGEYRVCLFTIRGLDDLFSSYQGAAHYLPDMEEQLSFREWSFCFESTSIKVNRDDQDREKHFEDLLRSILVDSDSAKFVDIVMAPVRPSMT